MCEKLHRARAEFVVIVLKISLPGRVKGHSQDIIFRLHELNKKRVRTLEIKHYEIKKFKIYHL